MLLLTTPKQTHQLRQNTPLVDAGTANRDLNGLELKSSF